MTVTISRLYDSYAQATEAVSNLERAGVPQSDISIVSNNSDNWYSEDTARRTTGGPATVDRDHDGVDDRAEGAAKGAGIGATAGGVVGLLLIFDKHSNIRMEDRLVSRRRRREVCGAAFA